MNAKTIWTLLKETFSEWSEDKASRLAASLAYYTVFSIAPLLIIVIAVAGLVFGREAAQGQIEAQIQGLIGEESAEFVQTLIEASSNKTTGTVAAVIGIATLLFGATGLFGQLQDALNTIWEVTPKPGRGVMGIIKDRFFSFTMVLGIGFLLMVSLVISAALATFNEFLGNLLGDITIVGEILNFIISFGVITLLFAMIYKILPDVEIAWSDVWMGAAVTALLFSLGKFLIGLYIGHSAIASSFGAAGALAVILIWVYYSAQILLLGAEFTQSYAKRFGSHIVPDEDAVAVTEEARAQQGMPRTEAVEEAAQSQERQVARPTATNRQHPAHPATSPVQQRPKYMFPAILVGLLVNLFSDALHGSRRKET
ncbi:MAG TPA: YihY/virulence factor BrkB family protein [Anaerolineae bacterium]|nr:YihY/virulence factor BrkB family protein [Anaerolineae bacterium]